MPQRDAASITELLSASPVDLTRRLDDAPLLNQFLAELQETLLTVEETIHRSGAMEARARLDLESLRDLTVRQNSAIEELIGATRHVAEKASDVATAAEAGAAHAGALRRLAGESQQELDGALRQLEAVAREAADTEVRVSRLLEDLTAIGQIAGAVSRVAGQTRLLSLNAAIEAAHAGARGGGFGVIAQEMRSLAEQAGRSAQEIGQIVGRADESIRETGAAVQGLARAAAGATEASGAAGRRLGSMFNLVDDVARSIDQTAESAVAQAALAEEMAAGGATVSEGVRQMTGLAVAMAGRQAARFVEQGQQALARFRYGGRFEQALDQALSAAAEVEAVLEQTLSQVPLADLLDTEYVEIKGGMVRRLAHLFDVSRAPVGGFDPPKYATRADHLIDRQVRAVLDRHLEGSGFVSMGVTDLNGFAAAMPSSVCRDWTGDSERDSRENRVKRLFEDPVGLRAARVGLVGTREVGRRASRAEFRRCGIDLEQVAPAGTFLAQTYARDTGAVVTDLAIPLHVGGCRYGALRCGFTVGDLPR